MSEPEVKLVRPLAGSRTTKANEANVKGPSMSFFAISALIFAMFFIGIPIVSKKLIFHPVSRENSDSTWDQTALRLKSLDRVAAFEEISLYSGDSRTRIVCWMITSPVSYVTVVLFHGNAGNIAHRGWIADRLTSLGASVLLVGYQGYGASEGNPSERAFADDASAAFKYLIEDRNIHPSRIIAFGESIGAYPALSLASSNSLGGVVLIAPFTSVPDIASDISWATRILSPFLDTNMYNLPAIRRTHAPLLVFATPDDTIVPFHQSQSVFDAAGSDDKQLIKLEDCGHNDMLFQHVDTWMNEMKSFIAKVVSNAKQAPKPK